MNKNMENVEKMEEIEDTIKEAIRDAVKDQQQECVYIDRSGHVYIHMGSSYSMSLSAMDCMLIYDINEWSSDDEDSYDYEVDEYVDSIMAEVDMDEVEEFIFNNN